MRRDKLKSNDFPQLLVIFPAQRIFSFCNTKTINFDAGLGVSIDSTVCFVTVADFW